MDLSNSIEATIQLFMKTWYASEAVPFSFKEKYTKHEQKIKYHALRAQIEEGFLLMKKGFTAEDISDEMVDKGVVTASEFLNIDQEACRSLMNKEYAQVTEEFVEKTRTLFPELDSTSVFQALRNVWIMVSIQILLSKPVKLTPSIFAYSMLYPLTDNLLDDPRWGKQDKIRFNERFTRRLKGKRVISESVHEDRVYMMVEMIESEFSRELYPSVFESLLLIQKGQVMSLNQHGANNPFETPLMYITFFKGAASVLADGYLVAGELTEEMKIFLMGYGIFLQLADDLQDAVEDFKNKHITLFSYSIGNKKSMTALTNRFCRFMSTILETAPKTFGMEQLAVLRLIEKSCHYLVFDAVYAQRRFFEKGLLEILDEGHVLGFKYQRTLKSDIQKKVATLQKKGDSQWINVKDMLSIGQRLNSNYQKDTQGTFESM